MLTCASTDKTGFAGQEIVPAWWLTPWTTYKRYRLNQGISQHLRAIVRQRYNSYQNHDTSAAYKSVVSLSISDIQHLAPELLDETCDQLRTFLFAGHDTTSTLIGMALYELSRTPFALQKARDEIDQLFGSDIASDPDAMQQRLKSASGPGYIQKMTYISAIIKETLRLYPPASSTRQSKPGTGFTVSTAQGDLCIDGYFLYLNHYLIHRDKNVFGDDANDFLPDRWFDKQRQELAPSAWRAFERGPKNCIGLELAIIEAKTVIALLAHTYVFEKMGTGESDLDPETGKPLMTDQNQYKTKSSFYMVSSFYLSICVAYMKVRHLEIASKIVHKYCRISISKSFLLLTSITFLNTENADHI